MRGLFDALSIFDWISPLVGIIRDTHHAVTDGEPTSVIWLQKYEMAYASLILGQNGIGVISEVAVAMDYEAGLVVRDSDYTDAVTILANTGIGVW